MPVPIRSSPVRLVILSDTHGFHDEIAVPEGDLLIHAGDATRRGTLDDVADLDRWLARLPHRYKVLIAGNHDTCFETDPEAARERVQSAVYLQDDSTIVEGLKIWGSPWQPWFHDWSFNLDRGAPLREKWALIPDDTDLLITHGPAHGVLDLARRGEHAGCEELALALERVRPGLHCFGHIHEARGTRRQDGVLSVNASICTFWYRPEYSPYVVDVDRDGRGPHWGRPASSSD